MPLCRIHGRAHPVHLYRAQFSTLQAVHWWHCRSSLEFVASTRIGGLYNSCIHFWSRFNLQLTYTISQTQPPFLDITLSISGDTVSTLVHYKDINTHNYLYYTSSHPKHCKNVIPSSLLRGWWLPAEMLGDFHLFREPIARIYCRTLGKGCVLR